MKAWDDFTRQYPEKAAAYKDRFRPLQQTFEGQERLRRYQEQKAQLTSNRAQGLEGSSASQSGATGGGLSLPPDIGETIQEPPVQPQTSPEQSRQFDPTILLKTENVGVDDFFNLDRDEVYGTLHKLAGIHPDQKVREKAQKIIDLIFAGKESYLQNNPGSTTINFT